jgi:hypothetical protein
MTQVLSALSPDHVVVVSDRRLINLADGSVVDDDACKIVALGTQLAFGFTGLANLRACRKTTQQTCHLQTLPAAAQRL